MIQQLLVFARKGIIKMKPFGLTTFLNESFNLCVASIPENIAIHKKLCPEELVIKGDATQLQQVLMNLINNARDALMNVSAPEITVKLETFRAGPDFFDKHPDITGSLFAHLSISDNGCGISPGNREHIFEPFFTTKDVGKGTGLGLPMAYGAMQSHDGVIEVESDEHLGTIIHLYLPLIEEKTLSIDDDGNAELVSGHGEWILIVDDNAEMLRTNKEVLENLGYRVLQASDGLQAISMFSEHRNNISLIIMDIIMPRLGGVKAFEQIREINARAKVIFSTGYDKEETLKSNMPSDKYLVLSKPYNIATLSRLIRKQLDA